MKNYITVINFFLFCFFLLLLWHVLVIEEKWVMLHGRLNFCETFVIFLNAPDVFKTFFGRCERLRSVFCILIAGTTKLYSHLFGNVLIWRLSYVINVFSVRYGCLKNVFCTLKRFLGTSWISLRCLLYILWMSKRCISELLLHVMNVLKTSLCTLWTPKRCILYVIKISYQIPVSD